MHRKDVEPGVLLKKSPFLVVKRLENGESRVYSTLHGNLTSFSFDVGEVLKVFDSPQDNAAQADMVSRVCQCDASELIRELYEKRFLVEGDAAAPGMLSEYVELARGRHKIPKVSKVTFLMSAHCNLACKGCYHSFYDFKSTAMSAGFADRILKGLFPYLKRRGIPALVISFLGYEPLLSFETIKDIYERASRMSDEHGIRTTFRIYTNAFDVTEEMIDWIGRSKARLEIKVSLDGIKEDNDRRRVDFAGHGTYDRVMKNLKAIIGTGVECGVLTVLSRLNFANLEKFVDEMAAVGIRTISANVFLGQSLEERQMELTEDEKFEAIRRMDLATETYGIEFDGEWKIPVVQMITGAQLFCPAGGRQLVFGADGVIYPCQRFAGTEVTFGKYEDDFWEKLISNQCESYNQWTSDMYDSVTERAKDETSDLTGCSCPFLPFIRGECLNKNLEKSFNERLLEYYVTRPLQRILARSLPSCSF